MVADLSNRGKGKDELPAKITDATFAVVDLETTGGLKPENRIIEICAIKCRNGQEVGMLESLVNPEQQISYFISQYTGITNSMVDNAPVIQSLLTKVSEFFQETIFVAHNVPFDMGFINMELERNGYAKLTNRWLCTFRLARRLLPTQQKKNLGDLAKYFGIIVENRHRARGDCEATIKLLAELIILAQEQHGVETAEELLSLQFKAIRNFKREPRHFSKIRNTVLNKFPTKSGVYLMKSAKDEVLYIGKSKNLKSRVSSYFNQNIDRSEKVVELTHHVRKIDYTLTGSELEALLLESKLIKQYKPRFNTLLKRYRSYPFLTFSEHEFPKLEIALDVEDGDKEYFGPFPSLELLQHVVEILERYFKVRKCSDHDFSRARFCIYFDLDRCFAPCKHPKHYKEAYIKELDQIRAFLSGKNPEIINVMIREMKALASENLFEEAADLKQKIHSLQKVFFRQSDIVNSVNENNVIAILPSENFSDCCKEYVLLFVRFGRLIDQKKVFEDETESLVPVIASVYHNGHSSPTPCRKEEIDEMQILSNWIYQNKDSLHCFYVKDALTTEQIHETLQKRLKSLSETR
ncbi:DNA polymerase III, epsilon subunit [Chloroherpeton thalassium ATCC 35110]|uniref:DNA polymerase III, epsilon subunit n=1 Tax=Chloroherpeton thalassium (strain ATCC 35110 / GB-78) TaxID=517418 RepID=B3QSB2_CHLT3|nr:DEDD exonuclease domain-containing protein [Chloroherpeton thalassium]ACF12503.1 DNA polymerase III, epsilon subunit [Chloroherpeton thalassium ATCC 35110]